MKYRQGFVSNSSSSSFVVSRKVYANTFELAKQMIPIREFGNDEELLSILEEAKRNGKDPDTNLSFRSCNYDTFLIPFEKHIVVLTCNNHPFMENLSFCHFIPKEVQCNLSTMQGERDFEALEELKKYFKFWFVECDMVGYATNDFCSEHGREKIRIDKEVICPECHIAQKNKIPLEMLSVARFIMALTELYKAKINLKEILPNFKTQSKLMESALNNYLDQQGYSIDSCGNVRRNTNEG
jgi:hypothetical protein